jgi:hypothetical protein
MILSASKKSFMATKAITVKRCFEPDLQRQARALLALLGYETPEQFGEGPGERRIGQSYCPGQRPGAA